MKIYTNEQSKTLGDSNKEKIQLQLYRRRCDNSES